MTGMEDVITAVGEHHGLAGVPPFGASIDQLLASENCAQLPILTCGLGCPALENLENGEKLLRIALTSKLVVLNLAQQPVAGAALLMNRSHGAAVECSFRQVDRNHPGGRVERLNGHSTAALPLAIGLSPIPGLKKFDRVHGS